MKIFLILFLKRKLKLARPKRFELLTPWFEAKYSIQLSYERIPIVIGAPEEIRTPDPLVRSQVLYPAELRARGDIIT
jgi:hypothetical protein